MHSVALLDKQTPLKPEHLPENTLQWRGIFFVGKEFQKPVINADVRKLFVGEGPHLSDVHYKHVLPETLYHDATHWEPSLGPKGFFSIVSERLNRFESNIYLVVSADNTGLSQDLAAYAAKKNTKPNGTVYTVGQFLNSPEYAAAKSLARRNFLRGAHQLAVSLGLSIESYVDDRALHSVTADNKVQRTARCLKPVATTVHNYLEAVSHVVDGRPANRVAVYKNCGNANASTGGPFIALNPVDGFAWLKQINSASLTKDQITERTQLLPCRCESSPTAQLTKEQQLFAEKCVLQISDAKSSKLQRSYPDANQVAEKLARSFNSPAVRLEQLVTVIH